MSELRSPLVLKTEQEMPNADVKKALELLKEAHQLLKDSELENLQRSANYLQESIQWLRQQRSGAADNKR